MKNPILERMAAHATVRDFLPDPLPEEDIARAVGCAQMAATSSWIQAYSLVQVTRPAERARLRELCGDQEQVERAGAFFVVCGDVRRHRIAAERAGSEHASNLETFLLGGLRNEVEAADELLELPAGVWTTLRSMRRARGAARRAAPAAPARTGGLWRKFRRPLREHLAAFYRKKGARLT